MKPRIQIKASSRGMIDNEFDQSSIAAQLLKQLDISVEGILKVNDAITADQTIILVATSMEKFDDGTGNGVEEYAIAGQVIWRKRGGSWTAVHTNAKTVTAGSFQFLKAYDKAAAAPTKKALYYTADGFLGVYYYSGSETWDDDVQTLANADTKAHPMETKTGYLYIGDGNYVARLEPAGASFDDNALVMTDGYRALCIKVYNDRLAIGTFRGSNIYDIAEAKLFIWDGVVGNEEEASPNLPECGITAIEEYFGYLIVFAGVKGNIYKFDGASIKPLPFKIKNVTRRVYVKPGAVAKLDGKLLFGLSDDDADASETALQGIYVIQRAPSGELALSMDYIESGGSTLKLQVGSIMSNINASGLYFSRKNASNSKIDKSSVNSAAKATTGEFNSQQYIWSMANEGEPVVSAELLAKPLPDGTSVALYIKKDGATSWGDILHTFTSTNQNNVASLGTPLAKIIQVKLVFTASGANSPEFFALNLY